PQTTTGQAQATATVSGTVTLDSKPARGVKVIALQGKPYDKKLSASAITDSEGRYQLQGVASGNCVITVDAPTLAGGGLGDEESAIRKSVHVEAGETIAGIDLVIHSGGVITGRITETGG